MLELKVLMLVALNAFSVFSIPIFEFLPCSVFRHNELTIGCVLEKLNWCYMFMFLRHLSSIVCFLFSRTQLKFVKVICKYNFT